MSALLWLGLIGGAGLFWFSRRRGRELDALDGGGPELIPELERLARDWETREGAIRRLEAHGAAGVPALVALLRDDSAARYAAESLGRLGDARALDPLLDLLKHGLPHEYGTARRAAAEALMRLGESGAGALAGAMWGAPSEVVEAGKAALCGCKDARGAGAARGLMSHPSASLRVCALMLLAQSLKEAAAPDLLRAGADLDALVRREAYYYLAEIERTDAAVALFKTALRADGDLFARARAAGALRAWKVRLDTDEKARAVAAAGSAEELGALAAGHASYLVPVLFDGLHERQQAALSRLTRLLTERPGEVPREALVALDELPREAGGQVLGRVYNGPCDETGHEEYVPVKLDLFPLRQLALQELQKRKKARKDGGEG